MSLKTTFHVIRDAVVEFDEDGATTMGAALAFYTSLSLAPLLVILMFVAGLIGHNAQTQLIQEIVSLVGPQAGFVIELIIENAKQQHEMGMISAILGIGALVLSAAAVFGELQAAINRIWDVRAEPRRGALLSWLRKRLLSLSMIAGVGFLMLVSLAISTALQLVLGGEGSHWKLVDLTVSLIIYTLLFAMIFKVLPDVTLEWRDVWLGAFVTAVLFDIGKFAIGKYLGYSGVGSAYGAAGSLIVLLVWVYYSSLTLFMGAEITQVISERRHSAREPEPFAVEGNP
jgi:membrane protein